MSAYFRISAHKGTVKFAYLQIKLYFCAVNRKQRYINGLSWFLTIAAYVYIGYKLYTYDEWSSLLLHFRQADGIAVLCGVSALLLMPVNMLLEAWRWQYLTGDISLQEAQRQVYFSKIAGQLTPYQLGEYPSRALLMKEPRWAEVLSLGVLGSMTMTTAIVSAGVVPLIVWLIGDSNRSPEIWLSGVVIVTVLAVTFLLPKILHRWVKVSYTKLLGSLGQSLLRYLCWCVQLALCLRLFGLEVSLSRLVEIPVYYLFVTIAPSVSVAEVGIRGATAMFVFRSVEATLAGMLLWAINSLLPMLIGTFVKKNAK